MIEAELHAKLRNTRPITLIMDIMLVQPPKTQGKWPRFGSANHLPQTMCFIHTKRQARGEKNPNNTRLPYTRLV